MEDRTEVLRDRRKGLEGAAVLYDPGSRRRKIDVPLRVTWTTEIILMNCPLSNVPDAHIQARTELMLDGKVVLLGVRSRRRVLRNDRRICSVCSCSGKRRVHRDLRLGTSRLRIADRAYKRKISERAINIRRRHQVIEKSGRAAD